MLKRWNEPGYKFVRVQAKLSRRKYETLSARIALMGSGETAPSMVKVHRALLDALGAPARAVLIDTTYGFQENADELTEKAQSFFAESLITDLGVASLRRAKDASALELTRFRRELEAANYIFAGPGSPSYALGNLHQVGAAKILQEQLMRDVTLCFASAAAVTTGRYSIPVYEIYKAGSDPFWQDGLNLLSVFGIEAAVVPHFDNHEGATHDTRFCYIGDRRLRMLEAELPDGVPIIGIDEHTCVTIDSTGCVEVLGKGLLTLRRDGRAEEYPSGSVLDVDSLGLRGSNAPMRQRTTVREADSAPQRFREALAAFRIDQAMEMLAASVSGKNVDETMFMVGELDAALADRFVDRKSLLDPLVQLIIELRANARAAKDYAASDKIRDGVAACGILLEDSAQGTTWRFTTSD